MVGAGVVGCAIARKFALEGASVVLLEKGADILSGASKANSAILHTGFDAPPASLELACMKAGHAEFLAIRQRLNLPVLETGAIVAAWDDEQLARLDAVEERAHANGVTDVRRISRVEILAREQRLSGAVLGGVLVPGEHVIDPWSTPLAYARQAAAHGACFVFGAEVGEAKRRDDLWLLRTPKGAIRARVVVNAAGLFGDRLEQLAFERSAFEIRPRKGQFVVFDKQAAALLGTILLPVPTEQTKGVVIARTIFGNLLVGPTAEEQDDRCRAAVDEQTLNDLTAFAARMVPDLRDMPVTAVYAGLRPATEKKDYRIASDPAKGWITVGGIRSTGLTAALGIATHVFDLFRAFGLSRSPPQDIIWPMVPNLAEHLPRDCTLPGCGEIVCHCERVTRREIEQALQGPLPAGDTGGLKRRTRAGMGRCQGFYCQADVAEIAGGRLASAAATPTRAP
ncbi:NAD(P)/FAD-dependent oxidoreductase [Phreatobacter stygius]|uniref:NAD(P)/FAD-dependent oxidoreductase n=1 Tax=Phreatobacter stygius TaxID=1940610 RepID=A0A4D7B7M4_9HYPH|nr:NAD(P)/FAD-dependent oxidoreductase [Phreatobacter stygius]